MKLNKSELEKLTESAVRVAGRAMSLLVMTGCPLREEYESVETLVDQAEKVRVDLGLSPVTERERLFGKTQQRRSIGFQYGGEHGND